VASIEQFVVNFWMDESDNTSNWFLCSCRNAFGVSYIILKQGHEH